MAFKSIYDIGRGAHNAGQLLNDPKVREAMEQGMLDPDSPLYKTLQHMPNPFAKVAGYGIPRVLGALQPEAEVPVPMEIEDVEPRMYPDQMYSSKYNVEAPGNYRAFDPVFDEWRRKNVSTDWEATDPHLGDTGYPDLRPPSFWDRVKGIPGNIKRRFGKNRANVEPGY